MEHMRGGGVEEREEGKKGEEIGKGRREWYRRRGIARASKDLGWKGRIGKERKLGRNKKKKKTN